MIKTVFFTGLTVVFFFIIWIKNPFAPHHEYELPEEAEKIVFDPKAAEEGRELFKQNCASCHSLRYDGIYLMSVTAKPEWEKIEKTQGKPIIEEKDGKIHIRGYFVPRDVYEAVAISDLLGLKASFGKIPPDLSTYYLARGPGYLYQFIMDPQKILPGTTMPKLFFPEFDKEAPEKVAKIVAYMRSVNEPPPGEKAKRTLMGVATIGYFILMGALLWIYRKKIVSQMH
ncbi:MAG: c-type cytochrome [Aquificae bacterium]|nr:c-type cytochrome [Aquificota bacterium]